MAKTRLMEVLFSAVEEKNDKFTDMVGEDIRAAVENGKAEDELNGLSYEHKGDGVVAITDKETGEVTMAERDPEGTEDEFQLWTPDDQIEGFAHPEGDGVTPGDQEGAPDEHAQDHIEGGSIADQPQPETVEEKAFENEEEVCPECGKNPCECEHEEEEEEKEFSSTNTACQKIFSKQELVEHVYSEVIESEETSTVGDLKFEKVPDEEAVVVTDVKSGDQAKVEIADGEVEVTELESKNFNEGEEELPTRESIGYFVVGLDAGNHQLVESQEASEEAANIALDRFVENGYVGVRVFDDLEMASEYAVQLLAHLGADAEEEAEVEEKTYSDGSAYYTRSFSTNYSDLMYRMFSESVACDGECPSEEIIKDALKDGEEVEVAEDVIIPLREDLGLIHDEKNDEYTKVELDEDGELSYEKLDEEEADALRADVAEEEGEEKEFSVYSNEAETRFFSENENLTAYMVRLFSEEADEEEIAEAIEDGKQIEKDSEIITPVDDETAVIEDKENGEFTKAVVSEDEVNVEPISEEEAEKLLEDVAVSEEAKDEEEKEFSVYSNEAETRFFSENENLTDYMVRLFSEEADEEEIAEAIEDGKQIEKDSEIITPIDEETAVIEDKENGEFTKAVVSEDEINVEPISEEEADELLKDIAVSEEAEDEEANEEEKEEEKHYSTLDRFFSDIMPAADGSFTKEVKLLPGQSIVVLDENGQPVQQEEERADELAMSVEAVEDKALAAIQAIQEASAAAEQAIQEAKAAPAEGQEAQLQEAQFSEEAEAEGEESIMKTFSETNTDNALLSWLDGNIG